MPSQPVPQSAQHPWALLDRSGSKQAWLAAGAITGAWLVAMCRWWLTDSVVPWDSKNQFFAFFQFLAASIHNGDSPFWNPFHYGGHPSIADPQSLIFQPLFVLWAWFDPAPTLRAFDLVVMAHLLAGGLAFVGLGERRDWPAAAQVLAALVFMFGGAAAARLNHTGIILGYGLFPVAILLLEVAMARNSLWHGLGFAVVSATIIVGRNQVALLFGLILVVLAVREIVSRPAPWAFLRARAGLLALVAAMGLALSVIPILLTLQFAALSNRPAVTLATALEASLYPANLLSMLVPNIFGSHAPDHGYWGPHYSIMPEVGATDDTFNYLFVGAVPVLLLLWHGLAAGGVRRPGSRTWAAILLFAVLFSLGRYTPLFGMVFEHVPGFSLFRRPIDGTFLLSAALAMLVGDLYARHVAEGPPRITPLPAALVCLAVLLLVGSAVAVSAMTGHGRTALLQVTLALPFLAAAAALLAGMLPRRLLPLAPLLLVSLAAGELITWNCATQINAEARSYYALLSRPDREATGVLATLERDIARRRSEGARPRVEILGMAGPWQNVAMVRGIEATNGYNPLRVGVYDRYVAPGEQNALAASRTFSATFPSYDSPLARALGLEYLVLDRPIEQLAQAERSPAAEALMAGPGAWVYRLPAAMPRVAFSNHVVVADADLTTGDGHLSNPPAADHIVIDDETPPAARSSSQPARTRPSTRTRIVSYRNARVEIDVEAGSPGILVLHDVIYPGWEVEVDGVRRPMLRADVMFRGVEIPVGRHRVTFTYRPLSWDNLKQALTYVLRPQPPGWQRTKETLIRLWQPYFPGD